MSDWIPKSHLSNQPAESEFVLHFVGVSDCWGPFPAAALTSRRRAALLYVVCCGKAIFCEEAVRTVAREKGAGHRNRCRAIPQGKSFGLEAAFLRTARRSGVQTVTREISAGD